MLKLSDLARRPDVQIGPLLVSPSRRLVEGPAGCANLEPVIMQVFLLLLEARGQVVTRAELFDQVWGGTMVGDDSLNRAVAKVRRVAAETAPGLLEIETIPRTGYRMVGEISSVGAAPVTLPAARPQLSRRMLIGGGVAAAAVLGGSALWWTDNRKDRQFAAQMAQGKAVLDYGDLTEGAAEYFRRATQIRPGDSTAHGLLAYSLATRIDERQLGRAAPAVEETEAAVRAAIAVDSQEPNGRLAQILVRRSTLDLATNEARLRAVLADDPDNIYVMRHLWNLLQSSGQSREALALVERAIVLKPLAATNHYPHAQLLWILGREAEAERVIERAIQYWPSHRWVRFARFIILAFTGRQGAALAMLNGKGTAPQHYSEEAKALWRISLAALEDRSAANVATAIDANLKAVKRNIRLASQAVMTLSTLGEMDAAFEVANAQLLFDLPQDNLAESRGIGPRKSTAWLFAPWLFTPPVAPMRADPRFKTLCDGIGLTEYWQTRQVRPDFPIGPA